MTYYIKLDGDNYEYILKLIRTMPTRQTKGVTSIALPGMAATSNILMALQGMQLTIDLTFTMYNDGTDKSNGTAPSGDFPNGVKTITEQKDWLINYIHSADIDAKWYFYSDDYPSGIKCIVNEISFDEQNETPISTDATIRLVIGEAI